MDLNLSGKRALVCGASKGIGAACAIELAQAGAEVVALARSEDLLQKVVNSLPGAGKHQAIACDFRHKDALGKKIQGILSHRGPIHILVNNTGGPKPGPITEATDEEFINAFQDHVLTFSFLAKLVLPGMKESRYGRIINIASTSVRIPIANLGVSNTTRAAVANWAKTLSLEVASYGVTVNNLLPGYTDTERLDELREHVAATRKVSTSEVQKTWLSQIPAGRLGRADEMGAAVCFLASPAAAYINGINLTVDGGRMGCF